MIGKTLTICDKLGLDSAPAARFITVANKFKSSIRVVKEGQEVDGKDIMGLLMLAAEYKSKIRVIVEGEDEEELMEIITKMDLFDETISMNKSKQLNSRGENLL